MRQAFREFQYPSPPLAVSDDFANTMMLKAIDLAFGNDSGLAGQERNG
ncbi:hypothetical protein ACFWVP_30785 [Streptomyces sp. NPDC058637]